MNSINDNDQWDDLFDVRVRIYNSSETAPVILNAIIDKYGYQNLISGKLAQLEAFGQFTRYDESRSTWMGPERREISIIGEVKTGCAVSTNFPQTIYHPSYNFGITRELIFYVVENLPCQVVLRADTELFGPEGWIMEADLVLDRKEKMKNAEAKLKDIEGEVSRAISTEVNLKRTIEKLEGDAKELKEMKEWLSKQWIWSQEYQKHYKMRYKKDGSVEHSWATW